MNTITEILELVRTKDLTPAQASKAITAIQTKEPETFEEVLAESAKFGEQVKRASQFSMKPLPLKKNPTDYTGFNNFMKEQDRIFGHLDN